MLLQGIHLAVTSPSSPSVSTIMVRLSIIVDALVDGNSPDRTSSASSDSSDAFILTLNGTDMKFGLVDHRRHQLLNLMAMIYFLHRGVGMNSPQRTPQEG